MFCFLFQRLRYYTARFWNCERLAFMAELLHALLLCARGCHHRNFNRINPAFFLILFFPTITLFYDPLLPTVVTTAKHVGNCPADVAAEFESMDHRG